MSTRMRFILITFFISLAMIVLLLILAPHRKVVIFNGNRAYNDLITQVSFGPRTPGSSAHMQEIIFIISNLQNAGWIVTLQDTNWNGFSILNIIASRSGKDVIPSILLGAHYDSRLIADQEPIIQPGIGVPGANDGASGVAILLELARTLPENNLPVWLVFFDAEDNAGIEEREGLMGSRAFVASLQFPPRAVVIVDMVGDSDLNIYIEANSDPVLVQEIWEQADYLGYEHFIPEIKFSILDDHIPFIAAGIQAIDIIDFDYPFWHTLADTPDKVSPASLQIVGEVLWSWILTK